MKGYKGENKCHLMTHPLGSQRSYKTFDACLQSLTFLFAGSEACFHHYMLLLQTNKMEIDEYNKQTKWKLRNIGEKQRCLHKKGKYSAIDTARSPASENGTKNTNQPPGMSKKITLSPVPALTSE
jgi:hypothetical protein